MSTATTKTTEVQERSVTATQKLCNLLGVASIKPAELKLLALALAEVVSEEIQYNTTLAFKIKSAYEELLPPKPIKANQSARSHTTKQNTSDGDNKSKTQKGTLRSVNKISNSRFNPYELPDPAAMLEAFGKEQLPTALAQFPLATLKEISAKFETANPGTGPIAKNKKEPVISYIIQQILNEN